MKFNVTINRDEDGIWIIECPSIPGCISQGETKPEALSNIQDAIAACLQVRAERGMPLTIETSQVIDQLDSRLLLRCTVNSSASSRDRINVKLNNITIGK
jgi:predicted RNase H-like HicB family nuclease